MTISDAFNADPRIDQAKKLVLDALKDHQAQIKGVKGPAANLQNSYAKAIEEFEKIRGAKLYYPYLGSGFGKGSLVELNDGSIKYDMITGIGPHVFGHSDPEVIASAIQGSISDTIMEGNLQQNIDSLELLKLLSKESGLPHCFLTSSGAMAVENGLKIAFQYRFPAQRLLAFDHCFAGRTLHASQITDKATYREGLPTTLAIDYVPFYENEGSAKLAVDTIKKYVARYPKQHAAMIIELVQGEGGFYAAPRSFFVAIIEALKEAGIAVFIDEIQTFGRLYKLFGFQYYGLEEYVDIVTIGKMSQVCATLFTEKVKPRLGLLSQTFTSSSVAIRTSSTIIKRLVEGNYYGEKGRIAEIHDLFEEGLKKIASKHPDKLEGPFGLGGMIAFTAYKGENKHVLDYLQRLFQKGVIAFSAGSNPTRVRLLAPLLTITNEDIKQVLALLEDALI